jgi:hypothetical protein
MDKTDGPAPMNLSQATNRGTLMVLWDSVQYRGFEINILPKPINATCGAPVGPDNRFRFPDTFAVPEPTCGMGTSPRRPSLSSTLRI